MGYCQNAKNLILHVFFETERSLVKTQFVKIMEEIIDYTAIHFPTYKIINLKNKRLWPKKK